MLKSVGEEVEEMGLNTTLLTVVNVNETSETVWMNLAAATVFCVLLKL